jgi:hypothetical protein
MSSTSASGDLLQKKYADDDKLVVVIIDRIPLRNAQPFDNPVFLRESAAPVEFVDLK